MTDNEKYLVMNAVREAQDRFLTYARNGADPLDTELNRRIYVAMYNLLSALELDDEFEDWEWGEEE